MANSQFNDSGWGMALAENQANQPQVVQPQQTQTTQPWNLNSVLGSVQSMFGGGQNDAVQQLLSSPKYMGASKIEQNQMMQNQMMQGAIANQGPSMMDNLSTGAGAVNSLFGAYDQLWGGAADYRDEQLGALKDQRSAFNDANKANTDLRAHYVSQFS